MAASGGGNGEKPEQRQLSDDGAADASGTRIGKYHALESIAEARRLGILAANNRYREECERKQARQEPIHAEYQEMISQKS